MGQLEGNRHMGLAGVRTILVLLCACCATAALSACGGATSSTSVALGDQAVAAGTNALAISPLPGTPDASPSTQISFLGASGTTVSHVSVVGSRSGRHSGRLRAYSTGTGESFLVHKSFTPGERVSVSAIVSAGTGAPAKRVRMTFTIAHQASVSTASFGKNPGDPHAVQRYATLPGAAPSTVTITTHAQPGAAPGDLFLAPYQADGTPGPMIARQDGTLVWFHPLPAGEDATNFQVQTYQGRPVLTWWQGHILGVGFGQGEDVIYDSSYRHIATIRAGNGYHADLHEIRLTAQGTAWIDSFDPIHMNLSSVHGSREGVLTDSVIEEVDIKTGLVMWEWHALGHVSPRDSYNPVSHSSYPWDYIHINSVDPGDSGDVLLSARNTWALYDVDMGTGAFRWQLGGPHSTVRQGPGAKTYWQHDAEWQPGGLISVFDNGSTPPKEKQSRGVLLKPDLSSRTVTLVKAYVNPSKTLLAPAQGNTLSLPGGDWLMGYGNLPNFTEYDSAGHVLLDGTLGRNVQDFRSYLAPWSGTPTTPPAVLAKRSGATVTAQTSWNGATGVASWQLLAGSSPSSLAPVASSPQTGFQTTLQATTSASYLATRALDTSGATLSTSKTIHLP